MNFSLTEEQSLLQDSIAKYLANGYSFEERRRIAATEDGFCRDHWTAFADLGWLTVPIPEDAGGFGGRVEDSAVVMEEFGKGLVLEPYLANVLLAGQLIARSGNEQLMGSILPALMEGKLQAAVAIAERQSRQSLNDVALSATAIDNGFKLNGTKVLVFNGVAAETVIVSARTSGDQRDCDGVTLLMADANADGLSKSAIPLMDGSRVANLTFENVEVPNSNVVGEIDGGYRLLEAVAQEARIAVCAELLGIMGALNSRTVEYTKTRHQFDAPISSFQALQHRMVDMFISEQQARSMLYRAICEHQQSEETAASTIAAMKALVGRNARHICQEAIQLHGGMGMTDELDIGHYVKRAMILNQVFGDFDEATREFCDMSYGAA